jgi:hypothetical protein
MPAKLTWDDLLIQNIAPAEAARCLGLWGHLVQGRVAPVFMSKFGDWFLRRPDGATVELSVIEGAFETVAQTPQEFSALANTQDWQELHLLSLHVHALHQRGLVPGPGQCYGFAPHPAFTGKIDVSTAMVMDILVWQSISAQIFAPKPVERTEVRAVSSGDLDPPLDNSGGIEGLK